MLVIPITVTRLADAQAGEVDDVTLCSLPPRTLISAVRDGSGDLKLISWALNDEGWALWWKQVIQWMARVRTTCSAAAIGGLLVFVMAASEAKAQCKGHYHTVVGGHPYNGDSKETARAAAENNWKVQVAAHDGSPWSNWAFAEDKTVGCSQKGYTPPPPPFEKPVKYWECQVKARPCRTLRPVTGPYVKELSGLDNLMVNWMDKYGFRAATLAVLKDKKLVYERGYGYQDKNLTTPILHNARMRLASVSLVLTKRALRQLIEDKLLDPEWFVYRVMNLPPWSGTYADESMKAIKIQHLLDDTSCFADGAITAAAGTSENPQKVIGQAMALGRNATLAESLKYIWSQSSTMVGGKKTSPWRSCTVGRDKWGSHFAMEVAAQIIAKTYAKSSNQTLNDNDPTVVGKKYGEYIKLKVGAPIEASFFQANNKETEAWPNEIWYKSLFKTDPEWNRNWASGQDPVSAAYGIDFFARPGSGTVVAAGRDFARYLKNYWHNGNPKPANLAGIIWYSRVDGSLPGTSAITVDQVWSTGVSRSFVVLVNMRNETITPDTSHNEITSSIESYLNGVTTWPTIDLF
jgi:CubicO group peptidase (beta-lactamase class C family)